jgi:rubrerythrin
MKWICTVCDYETTGDEPPKVCPVCGETHEAFEKVE